MFLVRKITTNKWRTDRLTAGEIPADAVTADLRTSNNALSLWAAQDADEQLNDAVLALVTGAERVDKIDVVWLERSSVKDAGIELDETDGRTPVTDLVSRHVDAVQLDLVRLGLLAAQVVDALSAGQHKRLTKKRVAQLIADAVGAGRVTLQELHEKVGDEVSKYLM